MYFVMYLNFYFNSFFKLNYFFTPNTKQAMFKQKHSNLCRNFINTLIFKRKTELVFRFLIKISVLKIDIYYNKTSSKAFILKCKENFFCAKSYREMKTNEYFLRF